MQTIRLSLSSSPINTPIEFELQTNDPANADTTHWATYMHEIDCSDIFISGSDFTKMMFATVIMTEAASHALVFLGLKWLISGLSWRYDRVILCNYRKFH